MKFTLSIVIFIAMSLFTSCYNSKCDDSVCLNNSECDRKTGDCIADCNNGTLNTKDGTCTCQEFYTGNNCENHVAQTYAGKYIGEFLIHGRLRTDTILLRYNSTNKLVLSFDTLDASITLTSPNAFYVNGTFESNGVEYRCTSVSGTFRSDRIEFEGETEYKYTFLGQEYIEQSSMRFSGIKQ